MSAAPLAGRRLGFVGLGLMGLPMCRNLLAAGADLVVYNRTREKADDFAAENRDRVLVAPSPAEVAAAGADTIVMNLVDTAAVSLAVEGTEPAGLLAGLAAGQIVIDMGDRKHVV